jgi:hypothetical protein
MAEINDELHELEERAEHGAHDRKLAPVSFTEAMLAVILALITVLGHRAHTHQVVMQTRANDQWGFYQGNDIRGKADENFAKLMSVMEFNAKEKENADKLKEWFNSEAGRRREKLKEIEKEARALEAETDREGRLANRYDLGEAFLEVALVITSITLLTRRRVYWAVGGVVAVLGIAVAMSSLFVH